MELRFDDSNDRSLVAKGSAGGLDWYLRQFEVHGRRQIVFAATHPEHQHAPRGCAGILLLDGEEPLFGVEAAEGVRFVWGLAPHGCMRVRVTDENDDPYEVAPDAGKAVDIREPFVLVLPAEAIPRVVSFIDAHGAVRASVTASDRRQVVEDRPVQVETTVSASGAVARVAASGLLDDITWTHELRRSGDQIDDEFFFRGTPGGGGGGGSGGVPVPTQARRIAVSGSGGGGGTWHVHGWSDPSITEIDLVLADGQVLRTRPFGEELGVGARFFAFCLRDTDRPRMLEGFDPASRLVDRCWLRSKVSTTEGWLDEANVKKRRAAEPIPPSVAAVWRQVTGQDLAPVDEVTTLLGEEPVTAPADRWPFTPVFTVAPDTAASHGPLDARVIAHQHRSPYQRMVAFALETSIGPRPASGPDTAEGAVVLSQDVWWSNPRGHRDNPNTTVRGRPAHFASYTAEVNNFEGLELSWIEPAPSLPAPFEGIAITLRADPRYHSQETLFAIAESLATR